MKLSELPSVDEVLNENEIIELIEAYARPMVVAVVREELNHLRQVIKTAGSGLTRTEIRELTVSSVVERITTLAEGSLKRVINATGVVLHTNLGRAVLPADVAEHVKLVSQSYTNLEIDLEDGTRGSRYSHVEPMLNRMLGCEAALVVNNNAAAVLLALNTLAQGREVIVSRGQLVEIGGSFRIPEIMKMSGATLVEIGTTNKTYVSDFANAITDNTALLLNVHTSNYKIVGFTNEVSLEEMSHLGRERNIPVLHDLGSGIMLNMHRWGLSHEPTVQDSLAAGVDVVTFSGDKLLGGPQAGIIAGKQEYIDAMKKNHLLRALRVDKMTIAALEATLAKYLAPYPEKHLPILGMLTMDIKEMRAAADKLAGAIRKKIHKVNDQVDVEVTKVMDMVGGGAYPTEELPGYAISIKVSGSAEALAVKLRSGSPAILTRVQNNSVMLHVRTLLSGDEEALPELVSLALEETSS
ncbi:MAG: L-seryl-tRNA(Sec) selenium transferase [Candidatus Saccharibacteria bacterium]